MTYHTGSDALISCADGLREILYCHVCTQFEHEANRMDAGLLLRRQSLAVDPWWLVPRGEWNLGKTTVKNAQTNFRILIPTAREASASGSIRWKFSALNCKRSSITGITEYPSKSRKERNNHCGLFKKEKKSTLTRQRAVVSVVFS